MSPQQLSVGYRRAQVEDSCARLNNQTSQVDGSKSALRSSLWVRAGDGRWLLFFHQGTPTAEAN